MSTYQTGQTKAKKRCPYCHCLFDPPTRKRGSAVRFCCPDHRKQYHKLGALPFSKLQDQIKKAIDGALKTFCSREELEQLRTRVLALEVLVESIRQV